MEIRGYLQRVYQELHAHPELSQEEVQTAQYVEAELRRMGFSVWTQVGGHGVVGVLDLGGPGLTLALRCDMDALPIKEETGVPFASRNPGVMHACGHDSHMTVVLGTCLFAAQNKEELKGRLVAVFQPAEETVGGAQGMIEDGLFDQFPPDRLVGVHNLPSLPVGCLGLQAGPITANADSFKAVFHGAGGHGALPHRTKDAIAMAAAGVQNAFAVTQRRTEANYPQVLSFGIIQGGTSFNIIPEKVVLEGTVRTVRNEDQEQMISLLHQAFGSAAGLYGGTYELEYSKGVPAVVNDEQVVRELSQFFASQIPEIKVVSEGLASLIGEDVSLFLQQVPGVLLYIGSGQEGAVNELHNPGFVVPQECLNTGWKALTSIVKGYLG